MKSFAVLAATFAGAALAQELPMPEGECAMLCVNNMAQVAESEYQCADDDISCFCTQSNWAFGIRDCSREACNAQESADAVQWAYARCSGVAATASDPPAALPILTSAVASATNVSPSGSGSPTASSLASVTSSAASSAASQASSLTSSANSAVTSLASSIQSQISSLTESLGSVVSSAAESATGSGTQSGTGTEQASTVTQTNDQGEPTGTATQTGDQAEQTEGGDDEGAASKVAGMSFAAGAGVVALLFL